jgi:alkanesulfonate monooxygenase SsuD/methylene tetrahydromethanopterin reductase-like flavin-dependent oxidoreductase (luciferase family)
VPLFNRPDPYRVAEEAAYVDVLSGGRLELGLVKGTGYELPISNQNPVRNMDRFWEAHDLVLKAFANRDGPMSWEGEYFHYRNINVIPRCLQQPHPPIWMPTFSANNAREMARRDYTMATFTTGYGARGVFDAYRDEYQKAHGRPAPLHRMSYLGMVAVGADKKTAMERGERVASYAFATERTPPGKLNPPGYMSSSDNARLLTNQGAISFFFNKKLPSGRKMSIPPTTEEMIEAGMLFCGTPDEVAQQIAVFCDAMGGVGNMLVQMGGMLEAEENLDSLRLFGTEVVPRLLSRQGAASQRVAIS